MGERQEGRRGRGSGLCHGVWVSLHSLAGWVRAPSPARPPWKVGYGGKELSADTGKGASSPRQTRGEHFPFAGFPSPFLEGFMSAFSSAVNGVPLTPLAPMRGFCAGSVKS